MSNIAVILGAGNGTRMKSEKSKLLMDIDGRTVIERTVAAFSENEFVDEIIVVCREKDLDDFEKVLSDYELSYCFGGDTRQQSVRNAVETIENSECDLIIIHDGARPLITQKEITDTISVAHDKGAAAVGVAVKDTIKVVDSNMKIVDTPDRSSLISIRTPQVFDFSVYKKALDYAVKQGADYTDDCRLMENYGREVYVVLGEYSNIKITTPEDLPAAQGILRFRGEES